MKHRLPASSRQKTGVWGDDKVTNTAAFDPWHSQVETMMREHEARLEKHNGLYFHACPAAPGLVHPLTISGIKKFLTMVPQEFLHDLGGIFLCPGSKKLIKARGTVYGIYSPYYKSIYLFPFHDSFSFTYGSKPKPSYCQEYERHGAVWKQEKSGWSLSFSMGSLRSFYLRDVLTHEIGHHVEELTESDKRHDQSERFAEWFAHEFGMRKGKPTEFGESLVQLVKEMCREDEAGCKDEG